MKMFRHHTRMLCIVLLLCCNISGGQSTPRNSLFVFIGEKIEVTQLASANTFDKGFKAKYKIIQRVYGKYKADTIEFTAYDHYGYPEFANYKTVMLFVSLEKGKYYHEKYQFFDVYKTMNGKWASPYTISDYEHVENDDSKIKPVIINFVQEVSYPTSGTFSDGTQWTRAFPEPYFKTVGQKAIAVYGNYVPELFKLKRNGVLTARGLF